jgi:hypothetical protein
MALAASIPLSQISTSVALFTIVGAWLLIGDFKYKIQQFKQHKIPFLLSIAVFLLFTIGLWNTENFAYALKDLKIKLPFLAIPILITSGPKLSTIQLKSVFYCLAFGAVLSAFLGYVSGTFFVEQSSIEFRDYSPFISHIRLSLMLCFALALFYDGLIHQTSHFKWLLLLPFLFILFYLNLIQSLTSMVILFLLLVYLLIFHHPWKYSKIFGIVTTSLFVLALAMGSIKAIKIYQDVNRKVSIPKVLPLKNKNGNEFMHQIENKETENGNLVGYFICNKELYQEWPKVSKIHLDSLVKKYPLHSALIRYLTSRGLTKDSLGISKLSKEEIKAIEKGVANVYYLKNSGLENRLHQTFWEIKNWRRGANSITNSVAIRLFFWDNAKEIIKSNFITGVGLGDVQDVINQQYQKGVFAKESRKLRSHNQYLTVFISLGIFGFLAFVGLIFYPFFTYKGEFKFIYIISGIIILSSMLWEDTLETQAGATLAALLIYLPFLNRRE